MDWPSWWNWEIELSDHLLERMVDRDFSETDLRAMLEDATDYYQDLEEGRWVIETRHNGRPWEVIVEPQLLEGVVVIVTAFPVG